MPSISSDELRAERANQLERTLTFGRNQNVRIFNLLWPLLEKNTDLCGSLTRPSVGMRYAWPARRGEANPLVARVRDAIYDFDSRVVIYAVAAGSPAAKAGVRPGDRVTSLATWDWSESNAQIFNREFQDRLHAVARHGSVDLKVERDGAMVALTLEPVNACNVTSALDSSLDVQARTNGREIVVTHGMAVRLDDEQIRTVLAHELAHCTMGHLRKATLNSGVGFFVDLVFLSQKIWLGGAFTQMSQNAGSIGLEREADYVSMYLLAKAGFSTENRAELWRNLADEVSFTGSFFKTHPYSPERYLLLTKTHEEIETKRSNNEDLIPTGLEQRG